jgi:hypothetical protein
MILQYGTPPKKVLRAAERREIAKVLHKSQRELAEFFRGIETVISEQSPEAKPLTDTKRLSTTRGHLRRLRRATEQLVEASDTCDGQLNGRLAIGCLKKGLGDFPSQVRKFRELLEEIDSALKPQKGGGSHGEYLTSIVYLCAIEYRKHLGTEPAKRPDGVFHRVLIPVLRTIKLRLPKDPYAILRRSIDLLPPLE